MSFWSKLGKGLAIGGAGLGTIASFGAASPALAGILGGLGMSAGTAGAVGAGLGAAGGLLGRGAEAAGNVGRVAGDTAGSLRDERFREDAAARDRDALGLNRTQLGINQGQNRDAEARARAGFLEDATLDRANLGITAPQARARQAAYGDALQNIQDVNIDFKPQTGNLSRFNVTGGIRPSMFGPNARAAGGELSRQALMALMTKSDVPAMPTLPDQSALVDLPELSTPQGSSALEKITGGVGIGGSILGALGPLLQQIKNQRPPTINDRGPGYVPNGLFPGGVPDGVTPPPTHRTTWPNTNPNIWSKVRF